MSSDDKNTNKPSESLADKQELPLDQLAKTRGTLPDKYHLDKNPIKYRQWDGSLSEEAHDKDYMELTLRSGKHSDLVQKLLRQKIEARAQEFPRWPGDGHGGVRSMWIESRYWYERERFQPHFDDDWREYRSKYLHSLELHPSEPLQNAEWEKFMLNPIRRAYMKPGDWLEKYVISKFTNNRHKAQFWRVVTIRPFFIFIGMSLLYYRLRYINQTWEWRLGQDLMLGKPNVYPGDPRWPWKETRTDPWHHYEQGFLSRTAFKDLRDFEDNSVIY